ncbi:AAA family ATPase [Vibrio rumoiensis]|uniref:Cell division protein ZipA n=1 Tax=Vibrio rumoiensis 1S-45 TaxID=1188252 RepID=A0A1E5DZP3_9VIBR|nr:ATP-binding protein [Vibrio rumoiensis]OEF23503.1 cell division protein ZipA [Vibrio rumoiensis 1S-45]
MAQIGKLYFYTGKMGSGKSTHSTQLSNDINGVHISEDEWLSTLYPDLILSFEDYLRFASRIKPLIYRHVQQILKSGADVVLDFPANTYQQREWFKQLVESVQAQHELIYIDADNAVCLQQIEQRRIEQPERAKFDTEAMFYHVSQYFEPPNPHEGFTIRVIKSNKGN